MSRELFKRLSVEQELLILTCRLTFSQEEKARVIDIIENEKVNWFEFLKIAFYHRVIILCWKNISDLCPHMKMPKYLCDSINYMYVCTKIRNQEYQKEIKLLLEQCYKKNISCIPVKGAYLIPNMYIDYGIRYSGDLDCLVKYRDVNKLKEVLYDLGYISGTYNKSNGKIDPVSRAEEVRWKLYMSNLHPYFKLSDNDMFPTFKIDFRFSLDDSRNIEAVDEIIDRISNNDKYKNVCYLIHLCTHFYGEAKRTASIATAKDMNLIKLCDIREYIIKFVKENDYSEIISFANKYSLKESIYFTLYCLNEIYNDGYEVELMKNLNIKDTSFMNRYGENTVSLSKEFNSSLWDRFFSVDNVSELTEQPSLFKPLD